MKNNEKYYTTDDISRHTGDSIRTVQRKLQKLLFIREGKYFVSEKILQLLQSDDTLATPRDTVRQSDDTSRQLEESEEEQEYDRIEYFTEEEYQRFHKILVEYPLLKEQLEVSKEQINYHRKSYEKQIEMHDKLLHIIQSRNLIEFKEKTNE